MNRGAIAFLLLITTLQLIGCGGGPTIKKLNSSSVIVAFGDSLTFGYGAGQDDSYPMVLAGLINCQVLNSGVPGEDSSAALRRLPGVLERESADLVILCSGGNDMLQKQSRQKMKANLEQMIQLIKGAGAEVLLIGVPEPGLRLKVPDLYEDLAQQHQLPYDGGTISEVLSSAALKSDLVHPNEEGYKLMAEAFFALIQKSTED